jgi:diguanylate cyclase (GGDEF)-like protein
LDQARAKARRLLAAVAVLLVLDLGFVLATPLPERYVLGLATTVLAFVAGLAGAVCAGTARRAPAGRPWWLMGAACASFSLGTVIWTVYASVFGIDVPFPSVADVFYLAFFPFAAAGLLALSTGSASRAGRVRLLLDGLVVASSLVALTWTPLLAPALGTGALGQLATIVATAYPLGDLVVLTLLGSLVAHDRLPVNRVPLMAGSGIVLLIAADTGFAVLSHSGTYASVALLTPVWGLGFLSLAAAAVEARGGDRRRPTRRRRASWLAHVALVPLVPLLAAVSLHRVLTGSVPMGMAVASLLAFSLVLVRQALAVRENVLLTSGLEQLIDERTASLRRLAYSDPLTALPNRRRLLDDLRARVGTSRGRDLWLAVADLDGFKKLNDSLGHLAGDEALRQVAEHLRSVQQPGEVLFRLGGDEFALLLYAPSGEAATAAAQRYRDALGSEVTAAGRTLVLRGSIGIAPVGVSADDALRDADLAMYGAKDAGGAQVRLFGDAMRVAAADRMDLERDLRIAITERQLTLAYQPIIELDTGRAVGVEALSRWMHPDRGAVSPAAFVALAEESSLILELGAFVLDEACRRSADWAALTGEPFPVWVNLSVRQLESPGLTDLVLDALVRHRLAPDALVLEVTEGLFLTPEGPGTAALEELRRHGLQVAVDDFGTGYSSLAYLDRLPLDFLKLDRSFVTALTDPQRESAITRAIIALGHSLQVAVVAEGVESRDQVEPLLAAGCRLGQGFALARPMTAADVTALLGPAAATAPATAPATALH